MSLNLSFVCVCFISGTLHVEALNLYTVWVDGRTQQMEHFLHPLVCVCDKQALQRGREQSLFLCGDKYAPSSSSSLGWHIISFSSSSEGEAQPPRQVTAALSTLPCLHTSCSPAARITLSLTQAHHFIQQQP